MKITKFGHCCMLIETKTTRVLIDPGTFSTDQNLVKDLDLVLITHEHADHFHTESVKQVIANNPAVPIYTCQTVADLLAKENIKATVVKDGQTIPAKALIQIFGKNHAELHSSIPLIENIGFFMDNSFFFPGDALTIPPIPVSILALPVAGPWMKIGEAVDYALQIRPKVAFPVHDGVYVNPALGHRIPLLVLPKHGIEFIVPQLGVPFEPL